MLGGVGDTNADAARLRGCCSPVRPVWGFDGMLQHAPHQLPAMLDISPAEFGSVSSGFDEGVY
jgi:hypothetical protein